MKTMTIPTDQGDRTVAIVDLFEVVTAGETFRFCVHTAAAVGPSLKATSFLLRVSECSTGLTAGTLSHGKPKRYSRDQAMRLIDEIRNTLGDEKFAAAMRRNIESKTILNPTVQLPAGGAA